MIRRIYHGSDHVIEQPVYGEGKTYNDYGLGFYCTESLDMAKEWGVGKDRSGFASCYSIDCRDLDVLDLNDDRFCILHWLSVLLENRQFDAGSPLAYQAREYILKNFHVDYEDSDIIIGNRADDSYFSFAQDFINGTISYRQLSRAMLLGDLGTQFVIKSKRAFERIVFEGYEVADHREWYVRKQNRDRKARREYFDDLKDQIRPDDLFVTALLLEEVREDDARLRRPVS